MPADIDPVYLGHHDVQQDHVRSLSCGNRQGFLTVRCGENFIAVDAQAGLEDVQVHGFVVHDEDTWRCSHISSSGYWSPSSCGRATALPNIVSCGQNLYGRYSRTLARSARGLKGFVTYASQPAANAFTSSPLSA